MGSNRALVCKASPGEGRDGTSVMGQSRSDRRGLIRAQRKLYPDHGISFSGKMRSRSTEKAVVEMESDAGNVLEAAVPRNLEAASIPG